MKSIKCKTRPMLSVALAAAMCVALMPGATAYAVDGAGTASTVRSAALTQPTSNPITFPADTRPGAPSILINGNEAKLSNNAIALSLDVSSGLAITAVDNKLTGERVPFTAEQMFGFTYKGVTYDLGDFTAGALKELAISPASEDTGSFADTYAGKAIEVVFTPKATMPEPLRAVTITYRAELLDGSNYVRHVFNMSTTSSTPLDVTDVYMVNNAQATGRVDGKDDGSPVVLGAQGAETAWIGGENPLAKVRLEGGVLTSRLPRGKDLAQDSPWEIATTIGVAPSNQMRRAFSYYVERERVRSRRTFLHFQSWFDLKPGGEKLTIDHSEMLKAEQLFFGEMNKRGAAVDSYWVDDGWDYLRDPKAGDESQLNVWSFDPVEFPNGFEEDLNVMAAQGAKLSVWMSPFGGYGTSSSRRTAIGNSKLSDSNSANDPWRSSSKVMQLSDPTYFNYFRDRVFDMIESGVLGFKFDGIAQGNLFITGANDALVADYEALFDLMHQMRSKEKDVWINATVGTWGSPYWLWYADSIYRDGNDANQAGQGNSQEKYVTYRDDMVHQNMIVENPLMPLNSVMNHGVTFSDRTDGQIPNQPHDFNSQSVRSGFANDLKNFFSMGIGLQELYLRNTFFDPEVIGEDNAEWAWNTIARNAIWARENVELLTDTHWIGGDPADGEIYGTAAWYNPGDTPETARAMIAVRNPSAAPAYIAVNSVEALEIPAGQAQRFKFVERDGVADAWVSDTDAPYYIELDPFEVLIYEGVPTSEAPTLSEEPTVDPCYTVIPRMDWEAHADSAQTTGNERDPASNIIDGNIATIWHTQWAPTQDEYPHWVEIDMGRVNTVCRLGYTPRTDGNTNGDIRGYSVEISMDGSAWEPVVSNAEFTGDKTEQFISIPEDKQSFRYVRLTATSAQNGSNFAGGAEIKAYGVQGASEWLARDEWVCTASDFEETGEQNGNSGHPEHACDGVLSTQWHSQYNPTIAAMPHWIQVDLGAMADVSALRYTPRQDAYPANGIVADFKVEYSANGQDWHEAATGTLTDANKTVIDFAHDEDVGAGSEVSEEDGVGAGTVRARYVRFTATSAQNGEPFAGAAEIDVRGAYVLVTPQAPTFNDEPGDDNDGYVIPQVEGVRYLINGNAVEPGTYLLASGQDTVQITAAPADGWKLAEGAWSWAHTYTSTSPGSSGEEEPELITVTPIAPVWDDSTRTYIVPAVDGVVYKVDGQAVTGTVRVSSTELTRVRVTAEPAEGYQFSENSVTEFTHEFPKIEQEGKHPNSADKDEATHHSHNSGSDQKLELETAGKQELSHHPSVLIPSAVTTTARTGASVWMLACAALAFTICGTTLARTRSYKK